MGGSLRLARGSLCARRLPRREVQWRPARQRGPRCSAVDSDSAQASVSNPELCLWAGSDLALAQARQADTGVGVPSETIEATKGRLSVGSIPSDPSRQIRPGGSIPSDPSRRIYPVGSSPDVSSRKSRPLRCGARCSRRSSRRNSRPVSTLGAVMGFNRIVGTIRFRQLRSQVAPQKEGRRGFSNGWVLVAPPRAFCDALSLIRRRCRAAAPACIVRAPQRH